MSYVRKRKRGDLSKAKRFVPYKSRRISYTPSVPRLLGSINEKKVVDTAPSSYVCDTTGSVTLLNGVATGTDFTDRIGRKIMLKSVYVRGRIAPVDGGTSNSLARVMIVYDMQANGAAPAITDILKTATSQDQLNMNNRDRFRVIMDKQFPVGGVDTTVGYAQAPCIFQVKKFKRLNLETLYSGTTNAIASIATGALFMVTIGDVAAGSGATFNGSVRVRFMDA